MEVPGEKLAIAIEKALKKGVKKLKKPLRLTTFLIGESADQISFVARKKLAATRLGIKFEFVHIKTTPSFEKFINQVRTKSQEPETTGIIIQQPLPPQLNTESVYDFVTAKKEIEGHRRKPLFTPPLGLAILTVLKYVYGASKLNEDLLIDFARDRALLKRIMRNEKVVLMGRGMVGGKPIGKTLTEVGINYININSTTPNPGEYIKDADVIITAVGKKVLTPEMLKPGVILINAGLRRENGKLRGDYDEKEVKDIARYYTPTPKGTGPLDVLYLYNNLIEAAKMQK